MFPLGPISANHSWVHFKVPWCPDSRDLWVEMCSKRTMENRAVIAYLSGAVLYNLQVLSDIIMSDRAFDVNLLFVLCARLALPKDGH